MLSTEVVTITRTEYSDLCEKAQKWDNITDERITYLAWRTAEQWEQFKKDAITGETARQQAEASGIPPERVMFTVTDMGAV